MRKRRLAEGRIRSKKHLKQIAAGEIADDVSEDVRRYLRLYLFPG